MDDFHKDQIRLEEYNKANVIIVPKKEGAIRVTDFKLISVINIIPKLIAKVLANRLSVRMPDLISPKQTAFIHGRQIMKNFITT